MSNPGSRDDPILKARERNKQKRLDTYRREAGNVLTTFPEAFKTEPDDPYGLTMMVAASGTLGKVYAAEDVLPEDAVSIEGFNDPFALYKNRPTKFRKAGTKANETAWRPCPVRFPDHASLGNFLDVVQWQPNACLVRAAVHPDTDVTHLQERRWHTTARRDGKAGGCLVPRSGFWLPCDLDGVPMPPGLSYSVPEQIIAWLCRQHLPVAFRDVTCVYQFSASAGLTAVEVINCHLWFLSAQQFDCRQCHSISRTFMGDCQGWDAAAAVGTQVNFTAAPNVTDPNGQAMPDPLGEARIGIFYGSRDRVDLAPAIEAAKERAERQREKEAEAMELARQRAATLDRGTIVNGYVREWDRIADKSLGDGPGRHGYDRPLFAMACAAVRNGETDVDLFIPIFRGFVLKVAGRRGELERAHGKKAPAAYLTETEIRRTFDNATRHVLFAVELRAGSDDHD